MKILGDIETRNTIVKSLERIVKNWKEVLYIKVWNKKREKKIKKSIKRESFVVNEKLKKKKHASKKDGFSQIVTTTCKALEKPAFYRFLAFTRSISFE